jgi:hypothetical protein
MTNSGSQSVGSHQDGIDRRHSDGGDLVLQELLRRVDLLKPAVRKYAQQTLGAPAHRLHSRSIAIAFTFSARGYELHPGDDVGRDVGMEALVARAVAVGEGKAGVVGKLVASSSRSGEVGIPVGGFTGWHDPAAIAWEVAFFRKAGRIT